MEILELRHCASLSNIRATMTRKSGERDGYGYKEKVERLAMTGAGTQSHQPLGATLHVSIRYRAAMQSCLVRMRGVFRLVARA